MKTIQSFFIVAALLFGSITVHAKNYYVSAAGNDANDGLTINTPWQNLKKINQFTFTPGDVILFRRGDTFYGSIIVPLSNLSFDAYGTGALPVITGFTTLSSWTAVGGGVYQAYAPTVKNAVNMVVINDVPQEVGRFPNSDAPNGGYLTATAFTGNTTMTATELSGTNWTGGEIISRKRAYVIERDKIISQSGGTITYAQSIQTINPRNTSTPVPDVPSGNGFGMFVQRDVRTLDKFGEWFYDSTTKRMSMYFGAADPASYTIKASTLDTLIDIGSKSYVAVNNLNLTGANMAAVFYHDNTNITVSNCIINNTGAKAIFGWYSFNNLVTGNIISNSMCSAIDVRAPSNTVTISNNTTTNTALFKGMASNFDPADAVAIYIDASKAGIVRKNNIDSCGYNGIRFDGSGILVDSNFVNHYCMNRDDGGGIYTYGNTGTNRVIKNNVVLNGIGARHIGTSEDTDCHGIYIDGGGSTDVAIIDNTIGNVGGTGFGIFLNSPKNVTVRNNTIYNASGWYVGRQYNDAMYNFLLKNNIFFSTTASQVTALHTHSGLNSTIGYVASNIQQSLQQMGAVDSNYYGSPSTTAKPFSWYYAATAGGGFTFPPAVNFASWQSYANQDIHTTNITAVTSRFEYNYTSVNKAISLGGNSYKDVYGTTYLGSITIAPFTSKVLMNTGVIVNQAPIANGGIDQTIALPTNTSSLTGTGTDADGTISSYSWVGISGPSVGTITSANTAITSLHNLVAGVYKYELTVTDNSGATGKDTVQVTVSAAPNQLPTANAGTDKSITLPVNSITLSGIATDADGTITKYAWTKIAGPASGTIVTPNAAITSLSGLIQGTYNFELTVTDNSGAIAKDSIQVTVNPAPNQLPTANAGTDKSITLPVNSITLSGVGTDADGTITKYAWTKITGPASGTIVTPNAAITSLSGLVQGTYNFELAATDNSGAIAKDSVQVIVNLAPNQLPTANAGTDKSFTLPVNSTTLSGIATDADGTITKYAWTKIAGPASGTIVTPNTAITSLSGLIQGTYNFELAVTDNSGAIAKDSVQVIVNPASNQAPTVNAGTDQTITLPLNSATLAGIGKDVDGTISSYTWMKISGPWGGIFVNAYAASTIVTGLSRGTYNYVLIVKDNNGLTAKDTMQLIVKSAPKKSVSASAGTSRTVVLPTNTTTLAGTATTDNTAISSYSWIQIDGPSVATIADPFSAVTAVKNLSKGNYKFEFAAKDNDKNIAKDTVSVTVEENHPGNKNDFHVYPNPVRNIANLEIKTISSKEITRVSVLVINLAGKIVARQNYAVTDNTGNLKLNMADLVPGFYTVQAIFENGETRNVKIIKLSSGRW